MRTINRIINGEICYKIEDIRRKLKRANKVNSFNKFIKNKEGFLQNNTFYILKSDYDNWNK